MLTINIFSYLSVEYVSTEEEVIKEIVWVDKTWSIEKSNIRDVELERSGWDRFFGAAHLTIKGGEGDSEHFSIGPIDNPFTVIERIR